jgi:hypothetical protein
VADGWWLSGKEKREEVGRPVGRGSAASLVLALLLRERESDLKALWMGVQKSKNAAERER